MQSAAFELITCAGALFFGESDEEYSDSDFDESSSSYSDDEKQEGDEARARATRRTVDELIDGSGGEDDIDKKKEEPRNTADEEDAADKNDGSCPATTYATSNVSSHKNDQDIRPTRDKNQQVGEAQAFGAKAPATAGKTSNNGNSNHFAHGGVPKFVSGKNLEVVNGRELAVDDNEDDDGTVATALDVTQDVSASEGDDDDDDEEESADVEPADVKIDLGDDDIDNDVNAFVVDLEDEFAPKKDTSYVKDACSDVNGDASKIETEDEEDEKSVSALTSCNANKAEETSGETHHHACLQPVEYTYMYTPQEQKWNVKYADLLRYYELYGTTKIPLKTNVTKPKHMFLRRWANKQRKAFLGDKLTEEQIEKLVAVRALDLLEV